MLTMAKNIIAVGADNRPPMLDKSQYSSWQRRMLLYIKGKEYGKQLYDSVINGPFKYGTVEVLGTLTTPASIRDRTYAELTDVEKIREAFDIRATNIVLQGLPQDIYNLVNLVRNTKFVSIISEFSSVREVYRVSDYLLSENSVIRQFEKLVNVSRAKKLEKSHDPLALVAHTGSSSRNTSSYYVTHPTSVVDYDDEYQQDDVHTNSEDPLASACSIIQGDRVNIQSRNSGNAGRNNRRAYVQEEIIEGSNAPNETGNVQRTLRTSSSGNISTIQCDNCSGKGHYARNCPKPRVQDSKYFIEQMLLAKQDEDDATRMEEIEELSANICLMARIQPADNTSDVGPSYNYEFISEVQSSSNNENEEQMYPTHTKIINSIIGYDQIDSDIIFDSPNENVNSGSVEKDT
ncbi:retrovirus-related pol polyprotein from transposon TNT 1-94, partial [Tanacetum coccineum]